MKQHSRAILQRSLSVIHSYRRNDISLGQLVSSLEGSLNALEEKMPEEFYSLWYSYWGNLETALALGIESQAQKEISEDLDVLEKTINKQLSG
jgi:wobble nucleotide-excising tRNase